MAKQEKTGFELLRSNYFSLVWRHLSKALHYALEDSLPLILPFGSWNFPFAEAKGAFQFRFKTAEVG